MAQQRSTPNPQSATPTPLTRRKLLIGGSAATFVGIAGCTTVDAAPPSEHASSTPASDEQRARPLKVDQTDAQRKATIESLTHLDDHPLYSLTWAGEPASLTPPDEAEAGGQLTGFACTLFAATSPNGSALLARNFDWDPGPASVMESTLSSGRQTLAVTDLRYSGIEAESDLEDPTKVKGLGRAEAYAFDGFNDAGVFIGLAADYQAEPSVTSGRKWIGGLGIQRMVLDHAESLEDALDLFEDHNVDFTGGPGLHYLLADRTGAKAVVEFDAGTLQVIRPPKNQPWMCLENFHMSTTPEDQRSSQRRYSTCADALSTAEGKVSVDEAVGLLDDVRQAHTQWQSVYDLGEGTLRVVAEKSHDFAFTG